MILDLAEGLIRWVGGLAALAALVLIFVGIWRGARQPVGLTVGPALGWLRSPLFYVVASALFGGFCILLWRPLPLALSLGAQAVALALGAVLYFEEWDAYAARVPAWISRRRR